MKIVGEAGSGESVKGRDCAGECCVVDLDALRNITVKIPRDA